MLAALLSACAAHPTRPAAGTPSVPITPWADRLRQLQSIHQFELNGRMAASSDAEAFSAGLRWRQHAQDAVLDLSGPLGLGAAHIVLLGDDQVSVTNAQGVLYQGPAAGEQIAATLGFEPPLASLRYWVLGASDPSPVTDQSLDSEQRLTRLLQQGWQIQYEEYVQVRHQWLPRRLTATRGTWRLRLVINAWQLDDDGTAR